jgi:hypothetical protein
MPIKRAHTLVSTLPVSGEHFSAVTSFLFDAQPFFTSFTQRFPLEARTLASHLRSRFRTSFGGQVDHLFPCLFLPYTSRLGNLAFEDRICVKTSNVQTVGESGRIVNRCSDGGPGGLPQMEATRTEGINQNLKRNWIAYIVFCSPLSHLFPRRLRSFKLNSSTRMYPSIYFGTGCPLSSKVRYG